jgi:radical SAM superfamily enzyme YgiQ (UPF0313 family)
MGTNKTKILLIRTTDFANNFGPIGGHYVPPMGILYLASSLMKMDKRKYEVAILNAGLETNNTTELEDKIKSFQPNIVGLSTITNEAELMHHIALIIKRISPEIAVVAGGPYPTVTPEVVISDRNINYAVIGEGEDVFLELVESITSGKNLENISGIAYLKGGKPVVNKRREFIFDLDKLPFPAWELIDIKKYSQSNNMLGMLAEETYAPIFTSRGCPYQCIYCHNIFGKQFRVRSAENVWQEMKLLIEKYGVREFHFYDDIFNLQKQRLIEICDLIIKSGYRVRFAFPNGIRGDVLDKEAILKLKEAGAYTLTFAVETASARLQKLVRKNINLKKINEAISFAAEAGLINFGFFMLGFPTETKDEMLATIEFARNSDLHFANFFQVRPFPNTELYTLALQNGFVPPTNFYKYNYHSYEINCSKVTDEDFVDICKYAYKRFYFIPRRILKLSRLIPLDMLFRNLSRVLAVAGIKRMLIPYHFHFSYPLFKGTANG